jgi:hypothetical protein
MWQGTRRGKLANGGEMNGEGVNGGEREDC